MKPFIFNHWHVWQGAAGFMLSDENAKQLRQFKTIDDVINWLFMNGDKPAARALSQHKGV